LLFTDTFEENGEIMVIIKLKNIDFPCDFVLRTMFNRNRQVTSVVETSELTRNDRAALGSSGYGLLDNWFFLWF
jgi:hypothetical protein